MVECLPHFQVRGAMGRWLDVDMRCEPNTIYETGRWIALMNIFGGPECHV